MRVFKPSGKFDRLEEASSNEKSIFNAGDKVREWAQLNPRSGVVIGVDRNPVDLGAWFLVREASGSSFWAYCGDLEKVQNGLDVILELI